MKKPRSDKVALLKPDARDTRRRLLVPRMVCRQGADAKGVGCESLSASDELSGRHALREIPVRASVHLHAVKEVSFTCSSGYQIDEAKQAFIVLPGSRCTISGKDGRFVSVWWDKPETSMIRRIVSTDNPYSFTATANRTLIPGYDAVSKEELTNNRTTTSTD